MAATSCPILEQEIVRFTVAQLSVVTPPAQTHVPALNSGPRVGLAYDLMDRGLVACTATDAHHAIQGMPRCICNEWSAGLFEERLQ